MADSTNDAVPASSEYDKIIAVNINRIYKVRQHDTEELTEFQVLKNVNLTVKKEEFLVIVGPSGCGKSTFLDMVAGLAQPTSGEIYMDKKLITGPALDRGIVLQGYALFPWRSVRKNVEFGLEIKNVPKKERAEISQRFIDLVNLNGFEDRYPHELSGGMKQRVAIARALAYDPEVLLMDEPFAAVDAQTREVLQGELLRIWEKTKKTIVFVTHSIDEAIFLADRVVVMASNPGTIKDIIQIELPRPRDGIRASTEFGKLRQEIWQLLQGQHISTEELQTNENLHNEAV
ncbi:ABC transporter ATP-binding protein [Pectinatus cerevisiiphilus]|uniref:ABC-type quaternary amine transporter n=1 Tax=Pectinatus cerevisiiphilus TaxID=86956 RepID=A0A4R3K438_9FIRM|nr:ABC transporter ATP-binding protein [Pectinatus cerevisiiphilus]TCS77473.1 NitT/TauT family transport system ATP-binding protein [Pectinatus cerevisiiphilus]